MVKLKEQVYALLEELKDYSLENYEHSVNVANLAVSFGDYLGLDDTSIEKLRLAGLLHDIGKLKIPNSILHKPVRLSESEYEQIKKHTIYGVKLLSEKGIDDEELLHMVLSHHERLDGKGYPFGLCGDSISFLLRILTVCDCYDAIISNRTYKESQNIEYLKRELINNSGTQFDENVVNYFLNYLDQKKKHI